MKTENNNPDPKEKITNTDPNETGTNNDQEKSNGKNPKLPGSDPDQTPEKETQDPPVANPEKQGDMNDPQRTKIGFNTN